MSGLCHRSDSRTYYICGSITNEFGLNRVDIFVSMKMNVVFINELDRMNRKQVAQFADSRLVLLVPFRVLQIGRPYLHDRSNCCYSL